MRRYNSCCWLLKKLNSLLLPLGLRVESAIPSEAPIEKNQIITKEEEASLKASIAESESKLFVLRIEKSDLEAAIAKAEFNLTWLQNTLNVKYEDLEKINLQIGIADEKARQKEDYSGQLKSLMTREKNLLAKISRSSFATPLLKKLIHFSLPVIDLLNKDFSQFIENNFENVIRIY